MDIKHINSIVTWFLLIHFYTSFCILANQEELLKGFSISPDPSITLFQPILTDSTGIFSLGLVRVNSSQLALSVVHVQSLEPLWTAKSTRPVSWADPTRIFFNSSLVISDSHSGVVLWSTFTDGDRVWLSNSSNLQINDENKSVIWQSFQHPTDTLVENQNFTSDMSLVSSNGRYTLRLGSNFLGMYTNFYQEKETIYLKHKAMEAKKEIDENQGPIYLVLNQDGFLGMYQNGSVPVDLQPFKTFNDPRVKGGIRKVRIESDGNLKGYFWTGSSWVLDYEAITETCELPRVCGPYGLCSPSKGCSCIDTQKDFKSGTCGSLGVNSGDFCGLENAKYKVLRRSGINLPYKELMGYQQMGSWAECEGECEKNCKCWGVVYNNVSGFCYTLDYPIQTMVSVGDESKLGYFKVREGAGKKRLAVGLGVGIGLLCGAVLAIMGFLVVKRYKFRSKRGVTGYAEEDGGVGECPYKDLGSASFRSIELTEKR